MLQRPRCTGIKILTSIVLSCGLLLSCASNQPEADSATGDEPVLTQAQTATPEADPATGDEPVLTKAQTAVAYAQSIWEIEQLRRSANEQIQEADQSNEPSPVLCNQPETMEALSGNIKRIAINYCNQSKAIVEEHQLTVPIFNQVTTLLETDAELKGMINKEWQRLKQTPTSSN